MSIKFQSLNTSLALIGLLVALSVQSGCQTTNQSGLINPHFLKVAYPKTVSKGRKELELLDARTHTNSSGLLVVDLKWFSNLPSGTPYQYKVSWMDQHGGVVSSSDQQAWIRLTMSQGLNPMRLVAKNKTAVDFSLAMEKK
jgi:hypothetical protein